MWPGLSRASARWRPGTRARDAGCGNITEPTTTWTRWNAGHGSEGNSLVCRMARDFEHIDVTHIRRMACSRNCLEARRFACEDRPGGLSHPGVRWCTISPMTLGSWQVVTLAAFAFQVQIPVMRVNSSLVLIPVHVTTPSGSPVTNLKKEEFALFEDGV